MSEDPARNTPASPTGTTDTRPAPGPAGERVGTPTRSGKAAWIVIGTAIAIGLALGVFVYKRASAGSVSIAQEYQTMRERGLQLDAEGCVTASLEWFRNECDAVGKMCIDAVPRMVGECLAAKDRSEACAANGNDLKPSQWAYQHCLELGIDKKSRKPAKESCTLAWRAFDSWCKSGQTGVAL
jgi:hypothetical protein